MDHLERAISRTFSELEGIGSLLPAPLASRTALPRQTPMPESTDRLQKWSSEALRAMETHLCLLQQGALRSFASRTSNHCFSDGRGNSKRPCLAVEGSNVRRNGAGLDCEMGPLVELNSQAPLPEGWEQFLDLRTGEIYYIDWNSCKRSYVDPRKVLQLANDKHSLSFRQRAGQHLQSTETEPDNSECLTDDNTCAAKTEKEEDDEMEVDSKWVLPMHEEDWTLMKWRGWLSPISDNQSEISSEPPSPSQDQSNSLSFGAEFEEEMLKTAAMGCQQCLSYSMITSEANPWCPQCGDALI